MLRKRETAAKRKAKLLAASETPPFFVSVHIPPTTCVAASSSSCPNDAPQAKPTSQNVAKWRRLRRRERKMETSSIGAVSRSSYSQSKRKILNQLLFSLPQLLDYYLSSGGLRPDFTFDISHTNKMLRACKTFGEKASAAKRLQHTLHSTFCTGTFCRCAAQKR